MKTNARDIFCHCIILSEIIIYHFERSHLILYLNVLAEKQEWAEPNTSPETKLLSEDDLKPKSYGLGGDDYDIQSFNDLLKKESDLHNGLESGNPNSHTSKWVCGCFFGV